MKTDWTLVDALADKTKPQREVFPPSLYVWDIDRMLISYMVLISQLYFQGFPVQMQQKYRLEALHILGL